MTGEVRILFRDPVLRIEEQDDDVCIFDRLQRFDDGKLFDRLEYFAAPAYACGVDQRVTAHGLVGPSRWRQRQCVGLCSRFAFARRPAGLAVHATVTVEVDVDRVTRRAGLVECDQALLADERVRKRRFADVGPADNSNFDSRPHPAFRGCFTRCRDRRNALERRFDHRPYVFAVRGRHGERLAERELVKFGDGAFGYESFRLVDGNDDRTTRAP